MHKVLAGGVTAVALIASAFVAPVAQAAPCDGIGMQQPFLDWHDKASYVLVDGGDFESGTAGWELEGGAATAPGGNPLRPDSSATSLSMPVGSSATTPPVCVAKGDPFARLFAQADATGKVQSRVKVEVLYLKADGSVRKVKKAGKLRPQADWQPTRRFSLAQGQFRAKAPLAKPSPDHGPPADPGNGNGPPADPGNGNGNGPPTDPGNGHGPPADPGNDHGNAGGNGNGHGGGNAGGNGNGNGGGNGDDGDGGGPERSYIALRFTALDAGSLIDDVFVDPRMRR